LREFIQVFAERHVDCAVAKFEQPDVAQLEQILAFEFCDTARIDYLNGKSQHAPRIHFVGSQASHFSFAHFSGRHSGFGIFLKPLALWQLFRIPPGTLANDNVVGTDIFGKEIQTLWTRLAECQSFQQRIQLAEGYLLPFAIHAEVRTSMMQSAHYLLQRNGATRIDRMANHCGLSVRQYERRFLEEIGLTPKLFSRIARFQTALDTKRMAPDRSWMSVAHEFGYFDQMHLIRDFRSLGGHIPSELLQQGRDFRPWSLNPKLLGR
jgi:AraC-like DNA-binding protein